MTTSLLEREEGSVDSENVWILGQSMMVSLEKEDGSVDSETDGNLFSVEPIASSLAPPMYEKISA
ncbi:hypothetical protein H5410_062448 [Solanum commersonii]|uniref:Uncharacterized protein n=1 Tax=Solanum commersonii TaxID=4109 RepID=A0A9J5WAV9_SOLCO|nr:hypothetical protein H5410_062448 [Solanum commersonii]